MRPIKLLGPALAFASFLFACGSDDSDASDATTASGCVAGSSVACAGPSGCQGYQVCRADGSAFDACVCGSNPSGAGGVKTGAGGFGYGGRAQSSYGGSDPFGFGGSPLTSAGGATTLGQGGVSGGATTANGGSPVAAGSASHCAPADMAGYGYPPYKPARRMGGSCTESDVQTYYTECYTRGNCADFKSGGSKAQCGECLAPTSVDAAAYGPIIRLGTAASPLDETNMAGCIELMGEGECAKKMMVSSLCEYYSCASNCPATDSATYQALMSCMMDARSSACSAAQSAAVCISSSAHVAACSASGFEAQFVAIAKVFCAQTN